MPSSRVEELRAHLDAYARARLTPADFEPALLIAAELKFDQITRDSFKSFNNSNPSA